MRWAPLRPIPGPDQRDEVFSGHRAAKLVRREHRERGLRQARADPGGRLEQLEDLTLVVVGEAVERQGVLADDQRGGELGLLADP